MAKLTDLYKNCPCNKGGDEPVIRELTFERKTVNTRGVTHPMILFIVRGSLRIAIDGVDSEMLLGRSDFIFAPTGSLLIFKFLEDTTLVEIGLSHNMPAECPVFRIGRARLDSATDYRETNVIHPLRANRRLISMVNEMQASLSDGFLCRHFLEGESTRFLFLLNAYYSEDDRVKFFSRVITPDIRFSEFVRMNHTRYRTINDMADHLCMTTQAFSNRFKKVFGLTPHRWIQREKARNIYREVCRTDIPLKEIAQRYGFPLTSNFFRFCKQTFGESPGNIRRNIRSAAPIK